ncbi:MAG: hypothetical protein U0640_13095 [Phycisphaerales bacterium]
MAGYYTGNHVRWLASIDHCEVIPTSRYSNYEWSGALFFYKCTARNGGEIIDVNPIVETVSEEALQDIGNETRLFGFPFSFIGYAVKVDCDGTYSVVSKPVPCPLAALQIQSSVVVDYFKLCGSFVVLLVLFSGLHKLLFVSIVHRRSKRGLCIGCGYSICDIRSHCCPECGGQLTQSDKALY